MLRIRFLTLGCAAVLAIGSSAFATTYSAYDLSGATNITGIYDTVAGGDSTLENVGGNTAGCYPANESPDKAIDGNTGTKYLAYGNFNSSGTGTPGGVNTGLYFTLGSAVTVNAIQFATANDDARRDPLTITLEGSNQTSNLNLGTSWTTIYSGITGLYDYASNETGRNTYGDIKSINNTQSFASYRILITGVRDDTAGMMQFSEVKLLSAVPEPSTIILLSVGLAGLLAYAWRKRK